MWQEVIAQSHATFGKDEITQWGTDAPHANPCPSKKRQSPICEGKARVMGCPASGATVARAASEAIRLSHGANCL